MFIYNHEPSPATVTGLRVAYRLRRPLWQRKFMAKALVRGDLIMTPLTRTQAAAICNVPYPALAEFLGPCKPESLADHLARASQEERVEAARSIGVDAVWSMIDPLLTSVEN
jgi:hypothetical protein